MFSIQVDEDITLKLPSLRDAKPLFALVDRNRRFLRQFLFWVDATVSSKDSLAFIKECQKKFKRKIGFSLCIFYKNQLVGMIGLHDIDWVNRKTEIGYWISQEYQGLGIISRSCRALISYTFEHLKLHRLEIQCAKQNLASRRIPEKLGFQQEALLRESIFLHGEFSDLILYGLLASQWHIPVKKNL